VITGFANENCGQADGSATASASGGSPPYSFLWSNSQTNTVASGLAAGNYYVVATDSAGCTDTASVTLANQAGPTVVIPGFSNASCGGNNGWATASGSAGTPPYSFSWNTNPVQNSSTASNLGTGTFSVIMTDDNGCSDTGNVSISNTTSPTAFVLTQAPATCGNSNGTATASGSGGNGPLSFNWDNGQQTAIATGLSAGNHFVLVTDSAGCSDSAFVSIINKPGPTAGITNNVPATCGLPNGMATVTPTGGTNPFTYLWNTNPSQNTQTAANLSAGIHIATVTDSNNCQSSISVSVVSLPVPVVKIDTFTNSSCGLANGSANSSVSGGSGTIFWSWNSLPVQSSPNASGLPAGIYSVMVTDSAGCKDSVSVQISNVNSLSISLSGLLDAECNGDSSGQAMASGSGGTLPYQYAWSNGETTQTAVSLPAGNHSVTVTDSLGCNGTELFSIGEPTALSATSSTTPDTGSAGKGTATVSPTGGTPPYSVTWNSNPPQNTMTATGLTPGVYSATVTDSLGCSMVVSDSVGAIAGIGGMKNPNLSAAIYPNPSDGNFIVSYSIGEPGILGIEFRNGLGQLLMNQEIFAGGSGTWKFLSDDFADGVYQLVISSGENRATLRVIIAR